ncbi:MAG: DUF1361 domain-containing protein [Bacteroidia bacterium]
MQLFILSLLFITFLMTKWLQQQSSRTLAMLYFHLFMLMGVSMVSIRVAYTGTHSFLFFIWNLFLAYLPFLITSFLQKREVIKGNSLSFYSLFSLWFLFLPNALYLLTDLKHIRPSPHFLFWYDLLIFIIFALSGFALALISLFQMHNLMEKRIGKTFTWIGIVFVCFANGFGVYLGRFLRWNSWDVFTNPLHLASQISKHFLFPHLYWKAWFITISFGLLFFLVYGMFSMSLKTQEKESL